MKRISNIISGIRSMLNELLGTERHRDINIEAIISSA